MRIWTWRYSYTTTLQSTSQKRDAIAAECTLEADQKQWYSGAYCLPDIVCGQGTKALRLQEQVGDLVLKDRALTFHQETSVSGMEHYQIPVLSTLFGLAERGIGRKCQISGTVHHFIKASDVNEGCDKQ